LVVCLDYGGDRLPDDLTVLFDALRLGCLSAFALCSVCIRPQLAGRRQLNSDCCLRFWRHLPVNGTFFAQVG
jgi:hypothetical protein